ncbi:hypothetical protein EZS27_028460, partial [termite gut metagenome]
GYNTDASEDLLFDDSRNFTVVANFTSFPYSTVPLDLCIVSADNIVVNDREQITKEIVPLDVKTKTLTLRFQFNDNVQVLSLRGTLDGAFASINLLNGKTIKDAGDIFFQTDHPDEIVKFRISDLYYSPNDRDNSSADPFYESKLSLILEVSDNTVTHIKTGEVDLEGIIRQISSDNNIPDDILLYVSVENFDPLSSERVAIKIHL